VISIYAYDARLEDQNTEIVTMLSPVELPAPPVSISHNAPPARHNTDRPTEVIRQIAMASVNHPEIVPDAISVEPNPNLPVPDQGRYRIGDHDSGPVEPGGPSRSGTGGTGQDNTGATPHVEVGTPPPPQLPIQKPAPVISKGVVTGLAISLPKPPYPQIAKQAGAHGPVNVQVLIDETGKVISAKAVSGHPLLMAAAVQAALGARFSPTRLGEQTVKVSGVITYNFVLQ